MQNKATFSLYQTVSHIPYRNIEELRMDAIIQIHNNLRDNHLFFRPYTGQEIGDELMSAINKSAADRRTPQEQADDVWMDYAGSLTTGTSADVEWEKGYIGYGGIDFGPERPFDPGCGPPTIITTQSGVSDDQ